MGDKDKNASDKAKEAVKGFAGKVADEINEGKEKVEEFRLINLNDYLLDWHAYLCKHTDR